MGKALFLLLAASIGMSMLAEKIQRAREQRRAVDAVEELGGTVTYDWQMMKGAEPRGPGWLRKLLGRDFFDIVLVVDLPNSQVTDARLENLEALTCLQSLDLSSTNVTDAGLKHLSGLTELRGLALTGTRVSDKGLVNLRRLSQLQAIDLTSTQVTDAGLQDLKSLARLRCVHVFHTAVSEHGVDNLQRALPNCKVRR